jgi:hypothetical protein
MDACSGCTVPRHARGTCCHVLLLGVACITCLCCGGDAQNLHIVCSKLATTRTPATPRSVLLTPASLPEDAMPNWQLKATRGSPAATNILLGSCKQSQRPSTSTLLPSLLVQLQQLVQRPSTTGSALLPPLLHTSAAPPAGSAPLHRCPAAIPSCQCTSRRQLPGSAPLCQCPAPTHLLPALPHQLPGSAPLCQKGAGGVQVAAHRLGLGGREGRQPAANTGEGRWRVGQQGACGWNRGQVVIMVNVTVAGEGPPPQPTLSPQYWEAMCRTMPPVPLPPSPSPTPHPLEAT